MAPVKRWPGYLALILAATLAVGLDLHAPWQRLAAAIGVNVAEPLLVAAGLMRLAGPRVQIDTIKGLSSLLVGMAPLVAAMSILDAGFTYLQTHAAFREQWSVTFVSTMLSMLLTAPLILAWSRHGFEEALELTRARLPELLVLYAGLIVTTYYVFGTHRAGPGFVPVCSFGKR